MPKAIENPILSGFHPDPSFIRVGQDYYIAVSTFEWYPGVQIYHSRDLANWRLVARPLDRADLLDMRGNPDSGGIWAPCLSYADGRFWLVYTDVKRLGGSFKDSHNYIITAKDIAGPWSSPIYVNSTGFDASLFHDDDGRKYFLNMRWNHRGQGTGGNPTRSEFDGIILQEWREEDGLIGVEHVIWQGTDLGLTEGPHIFKRGGYYYLTTAEGGTEYAHAVSMARSKAITGPYETHPNKHLITSKDNPDAPLQRTGHGQYVESHDGRFFHSFLCGRPIANREGKGSFCPLGRETGLAECIWGDDDWLYLKDGGVVAPATFAALGDTARTRGNVSDHDFTDPALNGHLPSEFQWLRSPAPEALFALSDTGLHLFGRESIGSWFEQALVARRQQSHVYFAKTQLDFTPAGYQQAAGLTTYYNRHKLYAVMVTHGDRGRCLELWVCAGDDPDAQLTVTALTDLPEGPEENVELAVSVVRHRQQFYLHQNKDWRAIGPELDATILSDEAGAGAGASFTGNFVGMIAIDTSGARLPANFKSFSYREDENSRDKASANQAKFY